MSSILSLLVATEYRNDIKSKSFWLGTFLLPIIAVAFGFIIGYLMDSSDAMKEMNKTTSPGDDLTAEQVFGMMSGVMLVIFIMIYGAQIFNKVKTEKTNRISEVLVGSVPGHTLMISKVISVGLIGLTQLIVWGALIAGIFATVCVFAPVNLHITDLLNLHTLAMMLVAIAYFFGGFLFYGSLFAASGALTDRNNENQTYMTIITFVLMLSMYIGMYSTDNGTSFLTQVCFYLPFTSPAVGGVLGVSGALPWWQTLLSLLVLYGSSLFTVSIAGKIYTSALLLKGKKFSPRDIMVFLRSR